VSKTNSHKFKDADMYEEYRQRWGEFCEVCFRTGLTIQNGKVRFLCEGYELRGTTIDPLERHHIYSVSGQRPDKLSNLLVCKNSFHEWTHTHQPHGRTIGVLCKLKKREAIGEPAEFDLDEINWCAGKNMAGVISNYCFEEEWMRKFQDECLRRLGEIAEGVRA
jgi:hypothetical protein